MDTQCQSQKCPSQSRLYFKNILLEGSSFIVPQVNHLALNTDYALRTGAFDPSKGSTAHEVTTDSSILKDKALERYTEAKV